LPGGFFALSRGSFGLAETGFFQAGMCLELT
jgi:hypothetical protein